MINRLSLSYPFSLAILTLLLIFAGYVIYDLRQKNHEYQSALYKTKAEFIQYREESNAVKQLEVNLLEVIKNGQSYHNILRNDIDNNLVQLRVKIESIERDSTATSHTADRALQIATSARQDYYYLRSAISYNQSLIEGWQQYYCLVIAPKNNTEFMCLNRSFDDIKTEMPQFNHL